MTTERFYRNLQKISGSFFVSLPIKWIKNFNLESKSTLAISILKDGNLLISANLEQSTQDLKDELKLEASPYVVRTILKNSLSGQMNIVVVSEKKNRKKFKR